MNEAHTMITGQAKERDMPVTPTLSSLLRANQAYVAQLSAGESLDWGVAFVSDAYPRLVCANQFREVVIDDARRLPEAFDAVTSYFAERGATCGLWAPAAGASVEAMEPFLLGKGFVRRSVSVLVARSQPNASTPDGIRVLPSRAMRKALRLIREDEHGGAAESLREALVDASVDRLNDARLDEFVALADGEPAGCCGLFQIGDIGRVSGLYVRESFRRRRVGTALMDHVLKLSKRLLMRTTCTAVDASDSSTVTFLRSCGFEPDGESVEFLAPAADIQTGSGLAAC